MPKVEIEVIATKTVEYTVVKTVNVPQHVLHCDGLFEWLEEEGNRKIWVDADASNVEVTDESDVLSEANVLD